jgi:aminoglycoside 6'-N-acetyltransferase
MSCSPRRSDAIKRFADVRPPRDIRLRAMTPPDLDLVTTWLREPHMARWYLAGTTVEEEVRDLRASVVGDEPTRALVVCEGTQAIGWCQWYFCSYYPDHADGVGAGPRDIGIDYAIGEPVNTGHGVGTALIAALVAYIRRRHPKSGLIADPEASNVASRKVLEKNGFVLLDERPVVSERASSTMAIYRLAPES